ncbi:MAG TPA: mucoidy inhibitor MuiA family protein, partial [Tenuifilaceae bacterium]|nr:mucoidy inhibitor MuiA family protein [Tenuifilaceae bacterium]
MKKLLALFFLVSLIVGNAYTQELPEKNLKIQVEEVTVFIDGAQLTGKATTELSKGKSLLKFTNLSPYIDAKSIRVKASNSVSVLAVNHQQNFVDRLQKPKELTDLEATLRTVAEGLKLENINLEINSEELKFMQDNRIIGGKNQETSVANFRETSSFYGTKISALKLKELEINKKIEELNKKQNELQNQLNTLTSQKQYPSGEVMVNVEASNDVTATFEVTFMVGNAGWFPSYDIRALSIDQPVVLVYKANIKQDSKTDWKNVKLKLSTSEPNVSGVPPTLKTYFLNYNTLPPTYSQQLGRVTGRVMDPERNPLPGVNVTVTGTTISTVTAA